MDPKRNYDIAHGAYPPAPWEPDVLYDEPGPEAWAPPEASILSSGDRTGAPYAPPPPEPGSLLGIESDRRQLWPERAARDMLAGAAAPGEAYTGRLPLWDPATGHTSDAAIKRSTDLAGAVTLGSGFAAPVAEDTLRAGAKVGFDRSLVPTKGGHVGPERIDGAVIALPDGRWWRGPSHLEAFERMQAEDPSAAGEPNLWDGFVTNYGRFVPREEAMRIAKTQDNYSNSSTIMDNFVASEDFTPGTLYAGGNKTAGGLYSAAEAALRDPKAPPRGSVAQFLAYLRNKGVKPAELEAIERVTANREGPVGNEGMRAFVQEAQLGLTEKTLGGMDPAAKVKDALEYLREQDVSTEGLSDQQIIRQAEADGWEPGGGSYDGPQTLYGEYQLPGGENYREHLTIIPDKRPTVDELDAAHKKMFDTALERAALPDFNMLTDPEVLAARAEYDRLWKAHNDPDNAPFSPPHFRGEKGLLMHARTNDRVLPDGTSTLHAEEIQSDLHQKARKVRTTEIKRLMSEQGLSEKDATSLVDENFGYRLDKPGMGGNLPPVERVPDAPFKKNWHGLGLKQLVLRAVKEGKDAISWTGGEAQAARYDLSKQVDSLRWSPDDNSLTAFKNGSIVLDKKVLKEELPDYVGKDVAQKLVDATPVEIGNQRWHDLNNQDLKVGGEGMRGFYDEMLPAAAKKLFGRFGARVERRPISSETGYGMDIVKKLKDHGYDMDSPDFMDADVVDKILADHKGKLPSWLSEAEVEAIHDGFTSVPETTVNGPDIHVMRITPELRRAVEEGGLPLWAGGGERGKVVGAGVAAASDKRNPVRESNREFTPTTRTKDAEAAVKFRGKIYKAIGGNEKAHADVLARIKRVIGLTDEDLDKELDENSFGWVRRSDGKWLSQGT